MRRGIAFLSMLMVIAAAPALASSGSGAAAGGRTAAATTSASWVSVFPVPGGQLAMPRTQITFRGLPISQVGQIVVVGSRTGVHTGRFEADSDGVGGSFIPAKPFAPLERVTVSTGINIIGAREGVFSFRIADPAPAIPAGTPFPVHRVRGDVDRFYSAPSLRPAAVRVLRTSPTVAAGDIFVAPQAGPLSDGPMILDPTGQLIYYHPLPPGESATDFRVQQYRGAHVLTWWQGSVKLGSVKGFLVGAGVGQDEIVDSSYRTVATVRAGNGLSADLHEFQLTPQGTALITAYLPVYRDASSVHGRRRALVLDSVVQEIDVPTGLVLFQWDSLDHVPLSDSYLRPSTNPAAPFDPAHLNSAIADGAGHVLISARNDFAAYLVSGRTGAIVWQLGGRHSSFRLPADAKFAFQHTVRIVPGTDDATVAVFDDGAGPPVVHRESRAVTLQLDLKHHTARLLRSFVHNPPLLALFEGSVQSLANRDLFVGWGGQPYFGEYNEQGHLLFDARFVSGNTSYRAYRIPWSAMPSTSPAATAVARGSRVTVYASWNGATEVARWSVLGGSTPETASVLAVAPRRGFETPISVPSAPYLSVDALDANGDVLGTSRTLTVH